MKCRKTKQLLFKYIDGLGDDTQRLELEKHLSRCPECEKIASQLTRSMDLIHRAPKEKTSEDFTWQVRLKVNREKNIVREQGAGVRMWNIRYATSAVAAFAVILAAGLFAVNTGRIPQLQGERNSVVTVAEPRTPADTPAPVRYPNPLPRIGGSRAGSGFTAVSTNPWSDRSNRMTRGPLDGPPAPLTVAELDSVITAQLDGLTTEQRIIYLRQLKHALLLRLLVEGEVYRSNH